MVKIKIENGKRIEFSADESEEVHGVYFKNGNSCEVPNGVESAICKVGTEECCVFLLMNSTDGFECCKFDSPTARIILDRLAKGEIRAERIGSCKLLGRKEIKE